MSVFLIFQFLQIKFYSRWDVFVVVLLKFTLKLHQYHVVITTNVSDMKNNILTFAAQFRAIARNPICLFSSKYCSESSLWNTLEATSFMATFQNVYFNKANVVHKYRIIDHEFYLYLQQGRLLFVFSAWIACLIIF